MSNFVEPPCCGQKVIRGKDKFGQPIEIPLQSGDDLYYNGPNLPGSGVRTCDNVNESLQKMDNIILDLRQKVHALQQTINSL